MNNNDFSKTRFNYHFYGLINIWYMKFSKYDCYKIFEKSI